MRAALHTALARLTCWAWERTFVGATGRWADEPLVSRTAGRLVGVVDHNLTRWLFGVEQRPQGRVF